MGAGWAGSSGWGEWPPATSGARTRAVLPTYHRFTLFNDHNLSNLSLLNLYFNGYVNFNRSPL